MVGKENEMTGDEVGAVFRAQLNTIHDKFDLLHQRTAQVHGGSELEAYQFANYRAEYHELVELLIEGGIFPQMEFVMSKGEGSEPGKEFKLKSTSLLDTNQFTNNLEVGQHILINEAGELFVSPVIQDAMSNLFSDLKPAHESIYPSVRDAVYSAVVNVLSQSQASGETAIQ